MQTATRNSAEQLTCIHTHTYTPADTVIHFLCSDIIKLDCLCVLPSGPTWCQLQGGQCDSDGLFIPLQCDETSCWCVSVDGQEVGGTRTPQETQLKPSCDRKNMCVSVFLSKVKEHF